MKIVLDVIAGPSAGAHFEFDRHETFLVGRSVSAHLQLKGDEHFSRHHFLLECLPPRCFLRDLGSTNGTFVNGHRVTETFLENGDIISVGRTRIEVSSPVVDTETTIEYIPVSKRESDGCHSTQVPAFISGTHDPAPGRGRLA